MSRALKQSPEHPLDRALEYNIRAWRQMYVCGDLSQEEFEDYVEQALHNRAEGRRPSAERCCFETELISE